MLSNKLKLLLSDKFNFNSNKNKSKVVNDIVSDTMSDTMSESESDSDIEYIKESVNDIVINSVTVKVKDKESNNNNDFIHSADSLNKSLPKKKYGKIHVCVYKINTDELYPFLMFLLYKNDINDNNDLNFTTIDYNSDSDGDDIVEYVLVTFREVFENIKATIEYKGFIEYKNNEVFIVLKYSTDVKQTIERGIHDSQWWWALSSEIINYKQILSFKINNFATTFLIENSKLALLYKTDGKVYETPEVAYYGNYYKKIVAVASLGLGRETPYASFGPYYYFSNFQYALRYAIWSVNYKPLTIDKELITIDDIGRYKKGGIVKFAIFSGKTKMLLGRKNDLPDDSNISKEMAEKSEFVKGMLKMRDNNSKWTTLYNSIRIGTHHIDTKRGQIITEPMIAIKEYEQQVPLEYYFVDTSHIKDDKDDKDVSKAVII